MTQPDFIDGRYDLRHLIETFAGQTPHVVRHLSDVRKNLFGRRRLPAAVLIPVYVRMARLMGCPVCRGAFPKLAPLLGVDPGDVQTALGRSESFTNQMVADYVDLAEHIIRLGGELPPMIPDEIDFASAERLQSLVRLEMMIHSVGLMFLPDRVVQRARV